MNLNDTDVPQQPLVSSLKFKLILVSFAFNFCRFVSLVLAIMDQIKQTSRGNLGEGFGEDYEVWLRTRQQIKPDDQLELTEAELIEDVVKVLDTENSTPAKNLVIFSFKESAFVPVSFYASKITF